MGGAGGTCVTHFGRLRLRGTVPIALAIAVPGFGFGFRFSGFGFRVSGFGFLETRHALSLQITAGRGWCDGVISFWRVVVAVSFRFCPGSGSDCGSGFGLFRRDKACLVSTPTNNNQQPTTTTNNQQPPSPNNNHGKIQGQIPNTLGTGAMVGLWSGRGVFHNHLLRPAIPSLRTDQRWHHVAVAGGPCGPRIMA